MPKTVTVNVGDTLDINIDPTTSPPIRGLQIQADINTTNITAINTQLANIYTKPEIDTKFISVYGNIDSLNDVVGVLGNDVTNLKAHPILNTPTNEPILVEISDNTKLNVNHNLMFDGSGSPDTSPVDPADTTKASYITLAYADANYGTTTGLDSKQNRFGTSTGWDSNCFQNSVGGNIYVKALTKAGISSYITYDQINSTITTLPTKQDLLTSSNAGQFINIDVSVPTIPSISVKESQLSNQIIGIDTYAYSTGTASTFNAIQTVNTAILNAYTAITTNTNNITTNTTNIAKGFYWKPISITGANTRTATVASGTLVPGRYLIGYNLNQAYSSSVGLIYKEFQYNNSGMLIDQLVTFTLLVVGNVTNLQTNGITFTITSNTGTLGFITSLDRKDPLTS